MKWPDEFDAVEELMEREKGMARLFPGVSAVTYFRMPEGEDFDASAAVLEEFLRQRVRAIVDANPWLTCFFGFPSATGKLSMVYRTDGNPGKDYLEVVNDVCINSEMPYEEVATVAKSYLVGKARIGDPSDQLFKVTLCMLPETRQAALLFSLLHAVGDGATFYTLYKMLDPREKVTALQSRREHDFSRGIESSLMSSSEKKWFRSLRPFVGTMWRSIAAKARGFVLRSPTMPGEGIIAQLSLEQIAQLKKRYGKDGGWVSTNDVITSWYLGHVSGIEPDQEDHPVCMAKGSVGQMAVNFRGRDEKLGHELAGNYIGTTIFRPGADITPPGVRATIAKDNESDREPTPEEQEQQHGFVDDVRSPWTVVTNWSAFYTELELPGGWSVDMHYPLILEGIESVNTCFIFNAGAQHGLSILAARSFMSGGNGSLNRLANEKTRKHRQQSLTMDSIIQKPLIPYFQSR